MQVINTILPILLVMLLGYALARLRFFKDGFIAGLNGFVYWIALPGLILHSLAGKKLVVGQASPVLLAFGAASLIVMACSFLLAKLGKLSGGQQATYTQASYRGNLALIGLPLLLFAVGPEKAEALLPTAAIAIALIMLAYNIISTTLFILLQPQQKGTPWWQSFLGLRSNPLIIATAIGLVWSFTRVPVPEFLRGFMGVLAQTAGPLSLICIGAQLSGAKFADQLRWPLGAAIAKTAVLPLLAFLFGMLLGIDGDGLLILLFFAAAPTAAASVILARQMGGDEVMASSAIALSTLLSMVSFSIVLLTIS